MRRVIVIGLLLLLAMTACQGPQREARQMVRRAERLFGTDPDSTVRLIDSVLRMPAYFEEGKRMDIAMLQAEALFGDRDDREISPLMDDEFFDDKPFLTTSPELERAADYYARKKKFDKAAHAALYSGFVQQHYGEKTHAMQSFKDAERYGGMAKDSLAVARAEYKMGKMLLEDGIEQEALAQLKKAEEFFGSCLVGTSFVQNSIAGCYMLLGDYENAELYLRQSLLNARKCHVGRVERKAINNYGVLYQLQGKYEQAVACLKQNSSNSNHDEKRLFLLNLNLGDVYFYEERMDSAAYHYNQVDSLLPFIQVKPERKVSAYKSLSRFSEKLGDEAKALEYRKKYESELYDVMTLNREQAVYQIQRQYDYETLQKTMNIKMIRRQRLIIVLSIAVVLVLLAFAISQIRLASFRRQETEIKASLLRFMRQNKVLSEQSEAVKKAHQDLEQKHQETEEARQNLIRQVEEYKDAYEASDKKLSKALQKEHQIMQKMAVYLGNKEDSALFDSLKHSVLGNQEYWIAMLKAFDKQFPGLRKNLSTQHPELTEMEQKILLLSYVDASREDSAVLLGTSVFMVDKLRTSVKKKMATSVSNAPKKA